MSTAFKKKVRRKERIVERSESYSAEINGYDVVFIDDEIHGARLSIYPLDSRVFPRAGIIEMRPERVSDIEDLADNLPALLQSVAEHLRKLGKDDLRTKSEREYQQLISSLKEG